MNHDQIAERLRLALDAEVARHELAADAWPRVERKARRPSWRAARIAVVCVAVAAAAAVMPPLWHKIVSQVSGRPGPSAIQLVIASRTHLAGGPVRLVAGYGSVWVLGDDVVYRIDPATGRIAATIRTPGTDKINHIATGFGAVWATSDGIPHRGVYRIDPRGGRVTSFISMRSDPVAITAAYGRVWLTVLQKGTKGKKTSSVAALLKE